MTEERTAPAVEVESSPAAELAPAVSYESIRDSVEGDAGAAWRIADHEVTALRQKYQKLEEDGRYSAEYKAVQAWRSYENAREKITSSRQEAREKLEAEARMAEHRSLPRPVGESLIATKNEDLLVAQNEATRLDRRVQRLVDAPGPFSGSPTEVLCEEYKKGLQVGGPEGRARCKGVLMAAEDRGIAHEELLNPLRSEQHIESLDQARRYRELASMIGNDIPTPPFDKPGTRSEARGSEEPRGAPRAFVPRQPTARETSAKGKSRRPPWS